jgi:hypothetical protein
MGHLFTQALADPNQDDEIQHNQNGIDDVQTPDVHVSPPIRCKNLPCLFSAQFLILVSHEP